MHCLPLNDVIAHVADDSCLCGPQTQMWHDEDGDLNFTEVHHSLDAREYREKAPEYEVVEGDLMAFKPFKKGNKSGTKKKKGGKKGVPASLLKSTSPKTPSKKFPVKKSKTKKRRKK